VKSTGICSSCRCYRHREHEFLWITHAGGAQSCAGRRASGDAIVNHDRCATADINPLAATQIALTPPFDFGEFAVADGVKFGFVDTGGLNHVLVAHDEGCTAIDDGAHGELRLDRYADLAHQDGVTSIRLLTTSRPMTYVGLSGFGIEIAGTELVEG